MCCVNRFTKKISFKTIYFEKLTFKLVTLRVRVLKCLIFHTLSDLHFSPQTSVEQPHTTNYPKNTPFSFLLKLKHTFRLFGKGTKIRRPRNVSNCQITLKVILKAMGWEPMSDWANDLSDENRFIHLASSASHQSIAISRITASLVKEKVTEIQVVLPDNTSSTFTSSQKGAQTVFVSRGNS